ncbi:hypothetical protein LPB19_13450 [Marinobacter salinisoli]|uniref:Uncharacterized protein n=1 Tax=Marinobacter salinisoli TaxID=2769486 RepID=A0ABX7MPG8_9GAMM|nr:hypothetical protein [Marinobacter salinisoli]QSP94186.1 hypothetical protein LPB19_13450 [Marinobacter salinisoli]
MRFEYILVAYLCLVVPETFSCERASTEYGIPSNVKSCQTDFGKMYDRLVEYQGNLTQKSTGLMVRLSSYLEENADREIDCTVSVTGWLPGELWKEQPTSFIMLGGDFRRYLRVADEDVPDSFKKMLYETASTNLAKLKGFIGELVSKELKPKEYKTGSC